MSGKHSFEITAAEQQLIETLRAHSGSDFRLTIGFANGAWEIETSEQAGGMKMVGRGVGGSFDDAWHGVSPDWA